MKMVAMFAVKDSQQHVQASKKRLKIARVKVKIKEQEGCLHSSMHANPTASIQVSDCFPPPDDTRLRMPTLFLLVAKAIEIRFVPFQVPIFGTRPDEHLEVLPLCNLPRRPFDLPCLAKLIQPDSLLIGWHFWIANEVHLNMSNRI
jgi:hypothetical protein